MGHDGAVCQVLSALAPLRGDHEDVDAGFLADHPSHYASKTDLASWLIEQRVTTLTGADFRGARGYVIDPRRNRVARAKFSMPDAVGLLHALDVVID